jgi:16S rRNA (uracil1498-N3)-methyltransferase
MAGLRAYHPFPVFAGATELVLSPAESAHLVRSLRARPGEALEAFDGTGRIWRGTVLHAQPTALTMRINSAETLQPLSPRLSLAQALPKGGLMDDIIRAAIELGALDIHPLFTQHCEVKLDSSRASTRVERWQTLAIEACKQSGNPFLPRIHSPESLKAFLPKIVQRQLPANSGSSVQDECVSASALLRNSLQRTLAFVGSLEAGALPFSSLPVLDASVANLLICIGPEGDFSPEEYALLRDSGVQGVRFGPHVLRVPTAAHYALVALDQLRQRAYLASR